MSHPALLAIDRADGLLDCYESSERGYALGDADLQDVSPDDADVDVVATGVTVDVALDVHLDVGRHEAFVRTGESVRAFRVLRFAIPTASGVLEPAGVVGALVAVHDLADPEPDGYVRGWFEAARACVGEEVDRGTIHPDGAPGALRDRLHLFAGDDVEVIDLPRT